MKKILLAVIAAAAICTTSAFAADLPVKAPVYKAVAPAFSWTGCYAGANAGGGWGRTKDFDTLGGTPFDVGSPDIDGFVGGGQIGCDYQTGALVFGVEGMFDWANIDGTRHDPFVLVPNPAVFLHSKTKSFATATARLGYAVGRSLWYVKGGAVWLDDKRSVSGAFIADSHDGTKSGWTAGAGLEFMVAPNWSAKIEYDYLAPGNENGTLAGNPFRFENHINVVLVGLNYRFSTGNGPAGAY